jgi:eukaryotic-like serine/threonine-protein kinase
VALLEGQQFHDYEVLTLLGEGSVGAVYKARQISLDRLVSLKVLRPELSQDSGFIARFKQEAIAAAKLNHPNLVQMYSAGESGGAFYLSMEFIDGDSLQRRFERVRRLDIEQSLATCYYLAHALDHAWRRGGLIHRAIKPSNIYLSRHGEVKLGDLGVARPPDAVFANDNSKPYYISPEQARGEANLDLRSDIYSLGCVLFHMLGGRPPHDGPTAEVVAQRHVSDPPPALVNLWPACPPQVALLLGRMMAKDPAARQQDYAELIADLVSVSEQLGLAAAGSTQRVAPKTPPPVRPATARVAVPAPRRSWWPVLLLLGVVAAATAVMIWAPWQERGAAKSGNAIIPLAGPAGGRANTQTPAVAAPVVQPPSPPAAGPTQAVSAGTPPGLQSAPSLPTAAGTPAMKESGSANPAEDAWLMSVASLPPQEQVPRVIARLQELNPGYDGAEQHRITDGNVTDLSIPSAAIKDVSPLKALAGLQHLVCGSSSARSPLTDLAPLRWIKLASLSCLSAQVGDLSPLRGAPLEKLVLIGNPVSDLAPLKGAPLAQLYLGGTQVADLSPLRGMKLTHLYLEDTPVTDLSPLENMPLEQLSLRGTHIADLKLLRGMPLAILDITGATVTDLSPLAALPLKQLRCDLALLQNKSAVQTLLSIGTLEKINNQEVAAVLQKAATSAPSPTMVTAPAPDPFAASVAALPAERQVAAVVAKLRELNPHYDGREQHRITGGAVTDLTISTAAITDLSPVRALAGLQRLTLAPWTGAARGALADLSPLKGMALSGLWCHNTQVADLSPLHDMPLTALSCDNTAVTDLSPLRGMKLTVFSCSHTAVTDLAPLDGMPLTVLWCDHARITNLYPLKGMPLKELRCDFDKDRDALVLDGIATLEKINDMPAASFWTKVGAIVLKSGGRSR